MTNSDIKRLLIFRPGHLGDTLVTLPAIWMLREKLPAAKFAYLYNLDHRNPHYITPHDVLNDTGLINEWVAYPFFEGQGAISAAISRAALLLKLRKLKFDTVAYLLPRERTLKQIERDIKFFSTAGVHEFIGIDNLIRSRFEINHPPATEPILSESDFLIECVLSDGFGEVGSEDCDLLKIKESETQQAQKRIRAADQTFVAVAPGSKRPSRIWSEDRFSNVLARLVQDHDIFPIFFGSDAETKLCESIRTSCGTGENVAGKLSIRESAALLKSCSFYLGNDTGTMHLAAAVGTPCVAIFSAADRKGQWEPFGTGHKVFRRHVECEGCRIDVCPRRNLCLQMIEADEVFEACVEMLDRIRD